MAGGFLRSGISWHARKYWEGSRKGDKGEHYRLYRKIP